MTFNPVFSRQIIVTTLLASAVLLGAGILLLFLAWQSRARGPVCWLLAFNGGLVLLLLLGSTAFRIRSYEITPDSLVIHLGLSQKRFPLAGLQDVRLVDKPFASARRDMGIGGLWSMYGRFSSPEFGPFSAYATGTSGGVLLVWPDKKVLITPDNPALFLQSARAPK